MTRSYRNAIFASAASAALTLSATTALSETSIQDEILYLSTKISADAFINNNTSATAKHQAELIEQALELATQRHVDGPSKEDLLSIVHATMLEQAVKGEADPTKITTAALNAAMSFLDPHSRFIPISELTQNAERTRGSFFGIGAEVSTDHDEVFLNERSKGIESLVKRLSEEEREIEDIISQREAEFPALTLIEGVKIQAVLNGETPAQKAGIQSGDIITHIDGEPLAGLTLQNAITKIKGPKDSTAIFTIQRPGLEEPLDLEVTRDEIIRNPVTANLIDNNTGHIRVSAFNQQTDVHVDRAIADLTEQGAERFILDLRDNPGGLVTEADLMVENFIDGDPRLLEYWKKRSLQLIDVAQGAFEEAFSGPDGTFNLESYLAFSAELTQDQKRVFVQYTSSDRPIPSLVPDIIQILEEKGQIETGKYVPYQPTPEDMEVSASSAFLHMRTIEGKEAEYFVTPGIETDAPMVVLVNENSASASEIVSGVLQNFERAKVIGTQTFGKGSGQTHFPIDINEDSKPDAFLSLTTFLYYIGKNDGYSLQNVGVTPDILVSIEFQAVSEPTRREAGMATTLTRPEDANYSVQSQYECKPSTVTVQAHGTTISEYTTEDMSDPFLTCAMAVLNGMESEYVEFDPIIHTDLAPE